MFRALRPATANNRQPPCRLAISPVVAKLAGICLDPAHLALGGFAMRFHSALLGPGRAGTELLNRRTFFLRTAGSAALAAGSSAMAPLFAAATSREFKIGACDWSLGKRGDPAALDVAKEIGLDGVQIDFGTAANKMRLRTPEHQKAYREAIARSGLVVSSLALCEMNEVPLKSDPRAAEWLDQSLDACHSMHLPLVMVAAFGRGDLDMSQTAEIDHLVKVLRGVAPKAEKLGVIIGLENYLSGDDNRRIIDRVGSPNVKVYYDVGNSTDKGRDVCVEIRALGKLICEFHAKDGRHMLGQGRIDFKAVRRAMDDVGFSGWLQLEAAHPHGLIPDYTADAKYLREVFPGKV
jgi:L-ribulose-5-phosphate 3-epimerase